MMRGGIRISFTEEEKKKALQLYDETVSISKVKYISLDSKHAEYVYLDQESKC